MTLLEFAFHSAFQPYGREFMRRVILRHTLHMLRGLLAYAHMSYPDQQDVSLLFRDTTDAFLERAANDRERLLVGTGFCQKPWRATGRAHDCPAGRFSHDCLYLSHLDLDAGDLLRCHPACMDCTIRTLGHTTLKAGGSFAVLTSALDIAHDILLPALEERRFTRVLFAICSYSVPAMSLALLTCGVEGYLFHYDSGACTNYRQWLRADGGDKPECTLLAPTSMGKLICILNAIAAQPCSGNAERHTCYEQVDHVFRPR